MNFSKFSPKLQKFLMKNPYYTTGKQKKNILHFYMELTYLAFKITFSAFEYLQKQQLQLRLPSLSF